MSGMAQQLLWIETLLKGSAGLALLLLPLTVARALGLPVPDAGLWPRLLGALLLGLAAAMLIEGRGGGPRGLGLAGLMLINVMAAATLIVLLVLRRGAGTARGKVALWILVVTLLLLTLIELPLT